MSNRARRRELQRLQAQQATQPQGQLTAFQFQGQITSGPLPNPQQLEEYNAIVPGAAQILFDEFQAQGKHRRAMEKIVVWGDAIRAQAGQLIGGAIGAFMVVEGVQLIREGHSTDGFTAIGIAIASAAGPFLVRNYLQSKERRAQQQALPSGKQRR